MTWSKYASEWASQHGGYDPRRAPSLPRGWHRFSYRAGCTLARLGVRPGHATLIGLGLAAAVPLLAGRNPAGPLVAAALVLLSALVNTLARALSVLTLGASARAAIREAVADRLGEVAWLAGLWAAGASGAMVVICLVLTWLYEYVRERALGAGMSSAAAQTAGERPMRVVLAAAGLTLAGLTTVAATGTFAGLTAGLAPGLLTVAAAGWGVLTLIGLQQLAAALRRYVD